jgi:putative copper export protein
LLALCGLLGFAGYSTSRTKLQDKLCAWLSILATVLLVAHLVSWLIHVSPSNSLDDDIVAIALSRKVGLDELMRVILAALAAWSVLLARRFKLGFAFALAAVLAGGTIGHPAAIDPLVTVPSKALHLVGVAFWFGGLLWLATMDSSAEDTLSSAGIVSNVALISIVVVALTGAVQSFLFLSHWSEVYTSAYGLTLIGKVAGLFTLALFGAWHRWRLMPRAIATSDVNPLKRSVRWEIAVMIAVVMLGGFLAYVPVPRMDQSHVNSTSSQDTR